MPSAASTEGVHHGGCQCKRIEYKLTGPPIFINCCHCRDCQCLSGTAFAINAMIEASRVEITSETQPEKTPSGMTACSECGTALWGLVDQFGDGILFLRVGTLDDSEAFPPDAHFFVRSKHPWVVIPEGAVTCETLPGKDESFWSPENEARLQAAMQKK